MTVFEYKVETVLTCDLEERLNALGVLGWEAVALLEISANSVYTRAVFKRAARTSGMIGV